MLCQSDELLARVIGVTHQVWRAQSVAVAARPFSALAFHVRGFARITCNGEEITTCPGDVLYMPHDLPYHAEYTEGEVIAIHFLEKDYQGKAESYTFSSTAKIYRLFDEARQHFATTGSVPRANADFFAILDTLRQIRTSREENSAFSQAVRLMHNRFSDPALNISAIAKQAGLSVSSLREKFTAEYGMSPIRYLSKLRVAHAVKLLSTGLYTVEAVSEASGFSDVKYFCRVIHRAYGYPPSRLFKDSKKEIP